MAPRTLREAYQNPIVDFNPYTDEYEEGQTEARRIREDRPIRSFTDRPELLDDKIGNDPGLIETGVENVQARTPQGPSFYEDPERLPEPGVLSKSKELVPDKPDLLDPGFTDFSKIDPEKFKVNVRDNVKKTVGYDPFADPYTLLEESLTITPNSTKDERNSEYRKIVSGISTANRQYNDVMKDFRDRRSASIARTEKVRIEARADEKAATSTKIAAHKEFNLANEDKRELLAKQGKLQADIDSGLADSPIKAAAEVEQIETQIRNLDKQINELGGEYGFEAPKEAPGAGGIQEYKTPEEVRAAFKAGKIDRETAKSLIKQKYSQAQSAGAETESPAVIAEAEPTPEKKTAPKSVADLKPGEAEGVRQPSPSENDYFQKNPDVGGMADFESNTVVLNPYSKLSDTQKSAVVTNEKARLAIRNNNIPLNFKLTESQKKAFKNYGDEKSQKETIIGRIVSGDSSALAATKEQRAVAEKVAKLIGVKSPGKPSEGSLAAKTQDIGPSELTGSGSTGKDWSGGRVKKAISQGEKGLSAAKKEQSDYKKFRKDTLEYNTKMENAPNEAARKALGYPPKPPGSKEEGGLDLAVDYGTPKKSRQSGREIDPEFRNRQKKELDKKLKDSFLGKTAKRLAAKLLKDPKGWSAGIQIKDEKAIAEMRKFFKSLGIRLWFKDGIARLVEETGASMPVYSPTGGNTLAQAKASVRK